MANDKDYTEEIIKKLNTIEDEELKSMIKKLIEERNYLIDAMNLDPLTGVYNRRILNRIRSISVLVLWDIDNFKTVNDEYGHDTGDIALKTTSKIIMDNCRADDIVCRYGGDEFLTIFDDCPVETVKKRVERIQKLIGEDSQLNYFGVTISVGISKGSKDKTLSQVIKEADQALYEAKKNGKNCCVIFDEIESNKSKVYRKRN